MNQLNDTVTVTEEVAEFVSGLCSLSGLELVVEANLDDQNEVVATLHGEDTSALLRENSRLLYAMNHLLNQALFRKYGREYQFVLDCDNYRATRTMELELLAEKAAEQVAMTGAPYRLQPMPAVERRVIHMALVGQESVETQSEGSGRYRRVVIVPAG